MSSLKKSEVSTIEEPIEDKDSNIGQMKTVIEPWLLGNRKKLASAKD